MWSFRITILVVAVLISYCFCETSPSVFVEEGTLIGSMKDLLDGGEYYSFKGIPYAQPPIGNLRFRDPLPVKPWDGEYNATEHGSICVQYNYIRNNVTEGSEDCLFLNIYTKSLNSSSRYPVMVYIHGGIYILGSGNSDLYGPEFLLQHDVIVVTMNYRLEAFGFLSLNTAEVPGNAGIKDQVLALKWIKRNIDKFGGDPDNVTIFGQSAGAASVTYHIVSPMSKGLFHKAIAQSGDALEEWASGRYERESNYKIISALGKEAKSKREILQVLRSVPAYDLAGIAHKIINELRNNILTFFHPIVEKRFKGVESFLNNDVFDAIITNRIKDVPLMIGYNSIEGLSSVQVQYINETQYLVPRQIAQRIIFKQRLEEISHISEEIKAYYLYAQSSSNNTIESVVNYITDKNFFYNTIRIAKLYTSITKQPVYTYRFNFDTDLNIAKRLIGINITGATHTDELFYLFYNPYNSATYNNQENLREIIYKLTKIWTNFAKFGNPTPDNSLGVSWAQMTSPDTIMNLDESMNVGPNPDSDRLQFWNHLYCKARLYCI